MATNILLSQPKITGTINQTAFYQPMTIGLTSPVMLLGHSNAPEHMSPYKVGSMKDAINWLNAESTSPLLRSLLEAYNIGCRDIWLCSVGPMTEYIADIADRNTIKVELGNKTFYEKYYERLDEAFAILREYDYFTYITAAETSYCQTGDVDFATQLATFCEDIFANTSRCVVGVLGTRADGYGQTVYDEMANNITSITIGDKGKYIIVVSGEGVVISPQMSSTYASSYATQVLALLATVPLTRSIFGVKFANISSLVGADLNDTQKEALMQAKVNPVLRSQRGKRGQTFETLLLTDNSMAPDNSDFWSINQVRLMAETVNQIKEYAEAFIGTNASEDFKTLINNMFDQMVNNEIIKSYTLSFETIPTTGTIKIYVGLAPIFGIRNIYFTVMTGPGSGG